MSGGRGAGRPSGVCGTTARVSAGWLSDLSRPDIRGAFHPVQVLLELAEALPDRGVPVPAAFPGPVRGVPDEVPRRLLKRVADRHEGLHGRQDRRRRALLSAGLTWGVGSLRVRRTRPSVAAGRGFP